MKRNMVLCYFVIRTWDVYSGVRVAKSLVFCVVILRSLFFPFCLFSFGHCTVCPSFYGFRLPLWHIQKWLNKYKIFDFDLIANLI